MVGVNRCGFYETLMCRFLIIYKSETGHVRRTMIRIEFVGGAKKLFATHTLDLDRQEIVISDLFKALHDMRLDGAPELDPKNTLVAINGSDTSVTGGILSVARDGDTVSIIPVIHGGSTDANTRRVSFTIKKRHVELAWVSPSDGTVTRRTFLDDMRQNHPGLHIQAVSPRFVLNEIHAQRILALSMESDRLGILLANKIETDILMRFALTCQISTAIKHAGISSRGPFILVAIGAARDLDMFHKKLQSNLVDPFAFDNASYLKRRFHITQKAINATSSDTPLEDILAERAAILGA